MAINPVVLQKLINRDSEALKFLNKVNIESENETFTLRSLAEIAATIDTLIEKNPFRLTSGSVFDGKKERNEKTQQFIHAFILEPYLSRKECLQNIHNAIQSV